MTPALRWAMTESCFNVSLIVRDKSYKMVSTDHTF